MKTIINYGDYEKAIDYFESYCPIPYCFGYASNKQNGGFCNGVSEAMKFNDIARSAIRKQIPMKPINATGYYRDNKCPSCGKPIKIWLAVVLKKTMGIKIINIFSINFAR